VSKGGREENTARETKNTKADGLIDRAGLEAHIEEMVHNRSHGIQEGFYGDALSRIDGEVDH
jgi:hypothetical protein